MKVDFLDIQSGTLIYINDPGWDGDWVIFIAEDPLDEDRFIGYRHLPKGRGEMVQDETMRKAGYVLCSMPKNEAWEIYTIKETLSPEYVITQIDSLLKRIENMEKRIDEIHKQL
jgi:hypothetical protein